MRNIVILGNNRSAIDLAIKLEKRFRSSTYYRICLVSEQNYFFEPQAVRNFAFDLTGREAKDAKAMVSLVSNALKGHKINFGHKSISRLDLNRQTLAFSDHSKIDFHKLVIASDTVVSDQNVAGVREYAHYLRTPEDAISVHRDLTAKLQKSNQQNFRVLIVGAGINGVEIANSIRALASNATDKILEIVLIDKEERILPRFPAAASHLIQAKLKNLDVEFMLGKAVRRVYRYCVEFSDKKILEYDFLLWAAGQKIDPSIEHLKLNRDKEGLFLTDETCQAVGQSGVYVVGPSASYFKDKIDLMGPSIDFLAEHIYNQVTKTGRTASLPKFKNFTVSKAMTLIIDKQNNLVPKAGWWQNLTS